MSPPDLHALWEVLHLQLGPGRTPPTGDHERRHGQRARDHAGHPTGRVPACVGGDRYEQLTHTHTHTQGSTLKVALQLTLL